MLHLACECEPEGESVGGSIVGWKHETRSGHGIQVYHLRAISRYDQRVQPAAWEPVLAQRISAQLQVCPSSHGPCTADAQVAQVAKVLGRVLVAWAAARSYLFLLTSTGEGVINASGMGGGGGTPKGGGGGSGGMVAFASPGLSNTVTISVVANAGGGGNDSGGGGGGWILFAPLLDSSEPPRN